MTIKALKVVKSITKTPSVFLGGMAFGTLGLKLLSSTEAKKGYATVLAKAYKAKDSVDEMISNVKQHTDDVAAEARDLYEAEKKAANLSLLEGE